MNNHKNEKMKKYSELAEQHAWSNSQKFTTEYRKTREAFLAGAEQAMDDESSELERLNSENNRLKSQLEQIKQELFYSNRRTSR